MNTATVSVICERFEANGPDHTFYHAMRFLLHGYFDFPAEIDHLRQSMTPDEIRDLVEKSHAVVVLLDELPAGPKCVAAIEAARGRAKLVIVPTIRVDAALQRAGAARLAEMVGASTLPEQIAPLHTAAWIVGCILMNLGGEVGTCGNEASATPPEPGVRTGS